VGGRDDSSSSSLVSRDGSNVGATPAEQGLFVRVEGGGGGGGGGRGGGRGGEGGREGEGG